MLPNGDYVASHDYYGPKATNQKSTIFASSDRGQTWRHLTDLDGQWWSGLFMHEGALHIMGVNRHLGDRNRVPHHLDRSAERQRPHHDRAAAGPTLHQGPYERHQNRQA